MLRLGFPVIGVEDGMRATEFWTAALNLVAAQDWASDTWRTLAHRDGSGFALALMRSESPVQTHPRLHLDLFVDTTAEQEAEIERLVGLGAPGSSGIRTRRNRTSSSSPILTGTPSTWWI